MLHEGVFFKQQAAARLLIQHVCCCTALCKIIHTVFVFRQPEHDVHSRVSGRAGTRPTTSGWCGTCTFLLEVLQHGYSMCGSYSPLWLCGKHDAATMRSCALSLNLLSAQCNSIQVLLLVMLSSAHEYCQTLTWCEQACIVCLASRYLCITLTVVMQRL